MIVGCAAFVVMMDILKYVFGIDVAKVKETKTEQKQKAKRQKYGSVERYRYVN